ncbi:MAG TPA: hypothetical protein VNA22_09315 [Pyrinomonadaceae bacterium]|nr:hypothetical protein [Pyrinomonadaceae bacterium]
MLTPDLVYFFAILSGFAIAIVNISFAIGVFIDSMGLARTRIVPGPLWAFATLFGGVFIATAYWFIHHSNLFDPEP